MVVVSGHVKRCQAVLATGVRISIPLQQQTSHLHVAILGGDVEGSETLLETAKINIIMKPAVSRSALTKQTLEDHATKIVWKFVVCAVSLTFRFLCLLNS